MIIAVQGDVTMENQQELLDMNDVRRPFGFGRPGFGFGFGRPFGFGFPFFGGLLGGLALTTLYNPYYYGYGYPYYPYSPYYGYY
jgi:hypothetical protein